MRSWPIIEAHRPDGGTLIEPFRDGICGRETDNGYGRRSGGSIGGEQVVLALPFDEDDI